MTDRNELERLLAAATKGPWEAEYDPIDDDDHATAICLPGYAGQFGTFLAYCQHNWNDAEAGEHRISWKEATANAALICFLRNNAQHYLSLMDEVERLRGKNEVLREVLADLVSWFPKKPSEPEWRLSAGPHGADDAINAARQALAARGYKIERIDNV